MIRDDFRNNWLHLYPMSDIKEASAWFPVTLSKASGSFYYNSKNKDFFDMLSGAFCCNFGHCRKDFIDAWIKASSTISFASPFSHINEYQAELSYRLSSDLSVNYGGKWCIFFVNSGSEAIECSINIVDGYNKRTNQNRNVIATIKGAYHGTTIGAKQVSSFDGIEYNSLLKSDNIAYLNGIVNFHTNHSTQDIILNFQNSLNRQFSGKYNLEDILAVVVEPVENCAGNLPMSKTYANALQILQRQYGVMIIADEVITGMGRLGDVTSSKQFSLCPEIIVLGKGLTGAHESLGAVAVRLEIAQQFHGKGDFLQHGATFGGRPASCAVALKALELVNDHEFQSCYAENVTVLSQFIEEAKNKYSVTKITGSGMLWTVHLSHDQEAMEIMHKALIYNGIISCIYPERILPRLEISPPLTTDPSDLRSALKLYLEKM
jgi:taurine-pyruvate aminotransferase